MSINVRASPGTKVIFSNPDAGYVIDQENAREHLKVGKKYTVAYTRVRSWHTDVFLKEVDGVSFNSVLFEEATK